MGCQLSSKVRTPKRKHCLGNTDVCYSRALWNLTHMHFSKHPTHPKRPSTMSVWTSKNPSAATLCLGNNTNKNTSNAIRASQAQVLFGACLNREMLAYAFSLRDGSCSARGRDQERYTRHLDQRTAMLCSSGAQGNWRSKVTVGSDNSHAL